MVDTSSYHGTYVNGVRVEHADLAVGDIIRIGGTKITIGASLPAR
jgi:pSer/pThr/pTyr-binding forkhead associated (FHA) protein